MASNKHTFAEFSPTAFELGLTMVHKDRLTKTHKKDYLSWLAEIPAKRWFDTDWGVSGLGVMAAKGKGESFTVDKIFQAGTKRYELEPWGLALVFQKEALDWDTYGVFKGLMNDLAKSAIDRYNLIANAILNNSFDGSADSKYLTFQSEALFTDTHTRLDGGTWSNSSSTGLSHTGMIKAIIAFKKQVNERGRPIMVTPKTLITSYDQEWIANTLLQTDKVPGTDHHDISTVASSRSSIKNVHTSFYITTAEHWWLSCDKNQLKDKMAMRLGKSPDLEFNTDPRTRDRYASSYMSASIQIWNSLGMWGSTGGG